MGTDFRIKSVLLEDKIPQHFVNAKLQVWDMKGLQKFRDTTNQLHFHALILAFDTTNRVSFNNMQTWLSFVKKNYSNARIILTGTKVDLVNESQISLTEIQHCITSWNEPSDNRNYQIAGYVETSSKEAFQVNDLFESTIMVVADELELWQPKTLQSETVSLEKLHNSLDAYIKKIESYKGAGSDINYKYGFWFFSESRAINRKINYLLAKELQTELSTQPDIKQVFNNIEEKRLAITKRHGLDSMADYKARGINSRDLKAIINLADQLSQTAEPVHLMK